MSDEQISQEELAADQPAMDETNDNVQPDNSVAEGDQPIPPEEPTDDTASAGAPEEGPVIDSDAGHPTEATEDPTEVQSDGAADTAEADPVLPPTGETPEGEDEGAGDDVVDGESEELIDPEPEQGNSIVVDVTREGDTIIVHTEERGETPYFTVVDEVPFFPVDMSLQAQAERWLTERTRSEEYTEVELMAEIRRQVQVTQGDLTDKWSNEEVLVYARTGEMPKQTSGGFWPNDPNRELMDANHWSREELVDFLKGQLKATKRAPAEALMDAIIIKWDLPAAWYERQVRDYVLINKMPEKTTDGLWVDDQVRDYKPARYWNREELKAWAADEILPSDHASEEQLVEEARLRYQYSENMSADLIKQLLATMKKEPATMAEVMINANLEAYARAMKPGNPMTEKDAAQYQTMFYNTLNRVLNMTAQDFVDNWTAILEFVNNNRKGLFDEARAYRGLAGLTMSSRDCKNFEQLMNLLLKTCNPATRFAAAKVINFDVALRGIMDEQVRQRVLNYYQIGQ